LCVKVKKRVSMKIKILACILCAILVGQSIIAAAGSSSGSSSSPTEERQIIRSLSDVDNFYSADRATLKLVNVDIMMDIEKFFANLRLDYKTDALLIENTNVQKIVFTGTPLAHLTVANNPELTSIDIKYTNLDSVTLAGSLPRLQTFSHTGLRRSQILDVSKLLPDDCALQTVEISTAGNIKINGSENLTTLTTLKLVGHVPDLIWDVTNYPKNIQKLTLYPVKQIKGLQNLTKLTELNLPNNQLKGTLNVREYPTNLQKLNLTENKLTGLSGVSRLINLTELNLSNNKLSGTLDVTEYPTSLQKLNFSKNQLANIIGLRNLTKLTELDLSENNLSGTINIASYPRSLQKLNFYHNDRITALKGFEHLNNLTEFNTTGARLSTENALKIHDFLEAKTH